MWKSTERSLPGGAKGGSMSFAFERSVDIARPASEVSAFVANLRNQKVWYEGLKKVEVLSGEPGAVGTRYDVVFEAMGRTFPGVNTITEHTPGRRVVLES